MTVLRLAQSENFAGVFGADHWQSIGFQHADLHKHAGLIPVDMFVVDLVPPDADDHNKGCDHSFAGRRDAG